MKKRDTHERKQAVALGYQSETQAAPIVIAKGKGIIAENIIERAAENNIPIQEDPSLVGILGELEMNQSIPEDLYQAVAEVFAFIYRTDQHAKNTHPKQKPTI